MKYKLIKDFIKGKIVFEEEVYYEAHPVNKRVWEVTDRDGEKWLIDAGWIIKEEEKPELEHSILSCEI